MPKVALFFDWLNQWGGAEKVILSLLKLYPQAPIYTLVHDPRKTSWLPPGTQVIPSFINRLPFSQKNPLVYTPLYDLAVEQFDFSGFDIVISMTTTIGHCLLTSPRTMFFCYYNNLNRYLYNTPQSYAFLKPLLKIYQKFDHIYSSRPDYSACISQTVKARFQDQFGLDLPIIYPGVDTNYYQAAASSSSDYFLTVSRLVPHKNIDLVVKAFTKLPYKLNVVGSGRQMSYLQKLAAGHSNIHFLGHQTNQQVLRYYQNCQALICPQIEDFGLTPIEAQACGKPVIALGVAGNTETIINGKTGIFFKHPTTKSLSLAINKFLRTKFKQADCLKNASKFSDHIFMLNFKQSVEHQWQQYQTTTF